MSDLPPDAVPEPMVRLPPFLPDSDAKLVMSQGDIRPGLTGWAAIEAYLTRLDQGMVDGFNDDINTLLTFVRIPYHFVSTYLLIFVDRQAGL